jgi:hypothetical protein
MAKQVTIFERGATEVVGVKVGFSWPAFFFGSLWAVVKRAWALFAVLLLVDAALWFGSGYAAQSRNALLVLAFLGANLAYAVIRGVYGNRWLGVSLRRRGFVQFSASRQ